MGKKGMDGKTFVRLIERELVKKGIAKGKFYEDCNLNSAMFSAWRSGQYNPSPRNVQIVSDYLGIDFEEEPQEDNETIALRELLRDRQDLRILLHSAKDAPASSVYSLIAQIEKMKEDNNR